jgi:hypothetical protein
LCAELFALVTNDNTSLISRYAVMLQPVNGLQAQSADRLLTRLRNQSSNTQLKKKVENRSDRQSHCDFENQSERTSILSDSVELLALTKRSVTCVNSEKVRRSDSEPMGGAPNRIPLGASAGATGAAEDTAGGTAGPPTRVSCTLVYVLNPV